MAIAAFNPAAVAATRIWPGLPVDCTIARDMPWNTLRLRRVIGRIAAVDADQSAFALDFERHFVVSIRRQPAVGVEHGPASAIAKTAGPTGV